MKWLSGREWTALLKTVRDDRETAIAWMARYRGGDAYAGRVLVKANEKLIYHIANRLAHVSTRDFEDVLQEGRMAILHAAEVFDGTRGTKPGTVYAIWIRHRVSRYLIDRGSVVRIPTSRYGRTKPDGTVRKDRASLKKPIVILACEALLDPHDANEMTFEDHLEDTRPLAETVIDDGEVEAIVPKLAAWMMKHLTPQQADVITRRMANPPETLNVIGATHEVSRERIRQVEAIALERCREVALYNGFAPFASGSFEQWVTRAYEKLKDVL